MIHTLYSFLLLSLLPALTFCIYGILRICHIQPPTESGMSEFMTSAFFIAGATVCYFTMSYYGIRRYKTDYFKWLAASLLLFLLALDETFMIHEQLSDAYNIPENTVFGFYGLLLLGNLYLFRKSCHGFWLFLSLFFVFCGGSQTADTLVGEGMITVFGRAVDYEQILEWLGAMCLTYAFSFEAYKTLGLSKRRS